MGGHEAALLQSTKPSYEYYGGKGISVCDEWHSFQACLPTWDRALRGVLWIASTRTETTNPVIAVGLTQSSKHKIEGHSMSARR